MSKESSVERFARLRKEVDLALEEFKKALDKIDGIYGEEKEILSVYKREEAESIIMQDTAPRMDEAYERLDEAWEKHDEAFTQIMQLLNQEKALS